MNALAFKFAWILALFVALAVFLIALTQELTKNNIAAQKQRALLFGIEQMLPPNYSNKPLADAAHASVLPAAKGLGLNKIYPVYQNGKPMRLILELASDEAYAPQPIVLLVAINHQQQVVKVRVVSHKETPGLGDKISIERSDWISQFDRSSLTNPPPALWQVKKRGGKFDQLTGATITSAAVVNSIKKALEYVAEHGDDIYQQLNSNEH